LPAIVISGKPSSGIPPGEWSAQGLPTLPVGSPRSTNIDPAVDCEAVRGLVTGISVKDFRAPKDVALTPGTGQVDFATMMKKLRAGGFTHGPLLIECLAPGDLAATQAEAKKAKRFVERLVASAA
jgi:sugar phosphate isomerase/epimerase